MPREGHDYSLAGMYRQRQISIHVPREGHDPKQTALLLPDIDFNPRAPRGARLKNAVIRGHSCQFQSTCPARGTTLVIAKQDGSAFISIHVPREGHDAPALIIHQQPTISIHVPREGHDQPQMPPTVRRQLFQSTCPARGTTKKRRNLHIIPSFQSTCPARGTTLQ